MQCDRCGKDDEALPTHVLVSTRRCTEVLLEAQDLTEFSFMEVTGLCIYCRDGLVAYLRSFLTPAEQEVTESEYRRYGRARDCVRRELGRKAESHFQNDYIAGRLTCVGVHDG
jgi:NADH:ubiquinone oxidoreductase subunit F (NADH-binding)